MQQSLAHDGTFTRTPDGYEFTIADRHFIATRNEAGFAGRQWELRELTDYGTPQCRSVLVSDMFATRLAATQHAGWLVQSAARIAAYAATEAMTRGDAMAEQLTLDATHYIGCAYRRDEGECSCIPGDVDHPSCNDDTCEYRCSNGLRTISGSWGDADDQPCPCPEHTSHTYHAEVQESWEALNRRLDAEAAPAVLHADGSPTSTTIEMLTGTRPSAVCPNTPSCDQYCVGWQS